jgi:riboflavin biosynthesis pyrimidine reductase
VLATGTKEGACEFIPASVDVHECSGSPLADAFIALAQRGVGELLIEPGPRLFSALWTEGLIDRLVVVSAGGLAGNASPPLFIGEAQRQGDALVRHMAPVEAGIVQDVSVTVWEPVSALGEE